MCALRSPLLLAVRVDSCTRGHSPIWLVFLCELFGAALLKWHQFSRDIGWSQSFPNVHPCLLAGGPSVYKGSEGQGEEVSVSSEQMFCGRGNPVASTLTWSHDYTAMPVSRLCPQHVTRDSSSNASHGPGRSRAVLPPKHELGICVLSSERKPHPERQGQRMWKGSSLAGSREHPGKVR